MHATCKMIVTGQTTYITNTNIQLGSYEEYEMECFIYCIYCIPTFPHYGIQDGIHRIPRRSPVLLEVDLHTFTKVAASCDLQPYPGIRWTERSVCVLLIQWANYLDQRSCCLSVDSGISLNWLGMGKACPPGYIIYILRLRMHNLCSLIFLSTEFELCE